MAMVLLAACMVEGSIVSQRRAKFWVWTVGLVSSWVHNVDNIILRPGSCFTPSWIVTPLLAFPMDKGFLYSMGTSLGIMHYMAQVPVRFSFLAHASILFEVIMGLVVGTVLLVSNKTNNASNSETSTTLHGPPSISAATDERVRYTAVPRQENQFVTASLELPERPGLRQRSRSPKVWS
jgi:hypothetical protein